VSATSTLSPAPAPNPPPADPDLAKINQAKPQYVPRYDFAGMMDWMEKNGLKSHPAYDRYSKLKDLKLKVRAMLTLTSQQDPLTLEAAPPAAPIQLWASSDGSLVSRTPPDRGSSAWRS